jgi:CubicO group peptidase (beta-lactamase class C family)
MRAAIIGFIFLLAMAHSGAAADSSPEEQVDRLFTKWNGTTSPGCALAVMKDGRIVYRRGYGMADLEHDIPVRANSIFHVASVSKQFTAAAIVLLVQEHKLSLDDQVRKYVPALPDFSAPITIRQLIHHTSGLRDQWDLLSLAGWRYSLDLITDDDVMSLVARQKDLNFQPGEEHTYCNTGYTLLGQVVKSITGKSLRDFTSERIFEPLGMKNTHFRDDHAEIVRNQALGYEWDDKSKTYRLSVTNFDTVGATSLLTTVEDLALWDQNFYEPRVGGAGLIEQMLQRGRLNNGEQLDYAFGLSIGKYKGLATVDHGGADAGYRSDLLRFPEEHFSVACLCNLAQTNPGQLTRQVADIYLAGKLREAKPTPAAAAENTAEPDFKVSESDLSQWVGLFWNEKNRRPARDVLKNGKLYTFLSADESFELKPLGPSRFKLVGPPVELSFQTAAGGKPATMTVHLEGRPKDDIFELRPEFKPGPAELAEFEGAYRSPEIDPIYRLVVTNDKLVLERLKNKPAALEPTIRDGFQGDFGNLVFIRDGNGKVAGFKLSTGRIRDMRFIREQ